MSPTDKAREKWENCTTEFPKMRLVRPVVRKTPVYIREDFRRFGNAIAWLQWDEDRIEIKKLETLYPGGGGPTRLIELLKAIADEFRIPLWGHARPYEVDNPFSKEELLNLQQLQSFYEKRGSKLRKIDSETSEILYLPT